MSVCGDHEREEEDPNRVWGVMEYMCMEAERELLGGREPTWGPAAIRKGSRSREQVRPRYDGTHVRKCHKETHYIVS